ncbi:MAG: protein-S-isoprenylcysteine O-methyltransferase [Pseudomonadota bacterium]
MVRRLALPLSIAVLLVAAALWRGILGPGLFLWIAMNIAIIAIRIPYEARQPEVAHSRKTVLEQWLLAAMAIGSFFLPLVWIVSPVLDFADRTQLVWPVIVGVVLGVAGLYVFYRSHADLGTNWSVSLQVREDHRLVTQGVYAHVRHPMYSAIFLTTAAAAFLLPNWVVGLTGLIGFTALYFGRVGREEEMMRDTFGAEWDAYAAVTPRLIPRL